MRRSHAGRIPFLNQRGTPKWLSAVIMDTAIYNGLGP